MTAAVHGEPAVDEDGNGRLATERCRGAPGHRQNARRTTRAPGAKGTRPCLHAGYLCLARWPTRCRRPPPAVHLRFASARPRKAAGRLPPNHPGIRRARTGTGGDPQTHRRNRLASGTTENGSAKADRDGGHLRQAAPSLAKLRLVARAATRPAIRATTTRDCFSSLPKKSVSIRQRSPIRSNCWTCNGLT